MEVKRGDIWFCDIPTTTENVQHGVRPVLVLSNNKANFFSPVITVCPISAAKGKHKMPTHVYIELEQPSFIICEQLMTINKKNLFRFVCGISDQKLSEVSHALDIQLEKVGNHGEINDIEIHQKVLRMVKSIEFLEEFVVKNGENSDIMNSIHLQVIELKDYCKLHNIDVFKIYKSMLKNSPIVSVKVG